MGYFCNTRVFIGSWDYEIRVICIFMHEVTWGDRVQVWGCNYIACRANGWSLNYTGQDTKEIRCFTIDFRAVWMVSEKSLDPVVKMVRYSEKWEFIEYCTVSNTIESLAGRSLEHSLHYDIWISLKKVCYCLEEVNKSCCGRSTMLECKLVGETQFWEWKLKRWINEVPDDNSFSNTWKGWRNGNGPVVCRGF